MKSQDVDGKDVSDSSLQIQILRDLRHDLQQTIVASSTSNHSALKNFVESKRRWPPLLFPTQIAVSLVRSSSSVNSPGYVKVQGTLSSTVLKCMVSGFADTITCSQQDCVGCQDRFVAPHLQQDKLLVMVDIVSSLENCYVSQVEPN